MESWSRISLVGREGVRRAEVFVVCVTGKCPGYMSRSFFCLCMPDEVKDYFALRAITTDLLVLAVRDMGVAVPQGVLDFACTLRCVAPRMTVLPEFF